LAREAGRTGGNLAEYSPFVRARVAGESCLPVWPASIREKNMTRRGWYGAVAAVAVLFGCQAYRPDEGSERKIPSLASLLKQECHDNATCQVDVDVDCPGGVCTAVVDPKVLLINGARPGQAVMFTLNAPDGFDFPAHAISFTPAGFDCMPQSSHKYKCTNANNVKGVFTYTVNVSNTGNGSTLVADPWVVNH
jgi:hypothetical protein